MSDDTTQPTSGSRWEQPAPQEPASQQPAAPVPAYAPAPRPRHRGRLLLAGGAVGVALVAGTGGFALGHATGDDDRHGAGRLGGPDELHRSFPGGPAGPMDGPMDGPLDGQRIGP